MAVCGLAAPHCTTIAHLVRTLRDDLAPVCAAVLAVCDGQGLIGREMLAIDGVKLPSHASTHRSGTRAEFTRRAEKVETAATTMRDRHRATDAPPRRAWRATHPTDRHGPTGGVRKRHRTDTERANMATDTGVIQGDTGVAAVDAQHQIMVDAHAQGTGSEQARRRPVVDALAALRTRDTVLTADAGYPSAANRAARAARGCRP